MGVWLRKAGNNGKAIQEEVRGRGRSEDENKKEWEGGKRGCGEKYCRVGLIANYSKSVVFFDAVI